MVDDQIALLLIMKIRFSSAENISFYLKLEKSLIFHSYQFSLQQGKCQDVKTRLIKVNLKGKMNFYGLQREQKLLCNLQNHAFSKTSLH